jgi:adenylate cyclase
MFGMRLTLWMALRKGEAYSKFVGSDEPGTLAKLAALRRDLIDPIIGKPSGRVFKAVGDGFHLVALAISARLVPLAAFIMPMMSSASRATPPQEGLRKKAGKKKIPRRLDAERRRRS